MSFFPEPDYGNSRSFPQPSGHGYDAGYNPGYNGGYNAPPGPPPEMYSVSLKFFEQELNKTERLDIDSHRRARRPLPMHSYPGGGSSQYYPQQQYAPPPGPPPSHPGYQHPVYIAPLPPPHNQPGATSYAPPPPSYTTPHPPPPPANNSPVSTFLNVQVPTPSAQRGPPPSVPGYDPTADFERLRKATKGFGTDESAVISTLAPLDSMQMANLSFAFRSGTGKDMISVLESETRGDFRKALHGLVLGPLWYDVELAKKSTKGIGTNEKLMAEIIADRTFDDTRLLSTAYQLHYGNSLESDVSGDLSAKTLRLYKMILSNSRPADNVPVNPAQVEQDVTTLHKTGPKKVGTDEIKFCEIIVNRSRPHLTAITDAYKRNYHKSLTQVIKSEFSGHMRDTLLFIVEGAKHNHINEGHGVWRDAKLFEAAMKGFGTKDEDLIQRVIRLHWDKHRLQAVKNAYHRKYKKSLEARVASETSGDYKKLLLALLQ